MGSLFEQKNESWAGAFALVGVVALIVLGVLGYHYLWWRHPDPAACAEACGSRGVASVTKDECRCAP